MPSYLHIETERYPLTLRDVMQETPNTSWPDNGTPDEEALRLHGYAQVLDSDPPQAALGKQAIESGWTLGEDGVYRTAWAVVPLALEDVRRSRKEAVTRRRTEEEASGLRWTRSDGTVYMIATDPEVSQGKLNAERSAALSGLREPGDVWKCAEAATGATVFVPFDDDEIVDIANKARAKVSGTYKREGQLHAAIDTAETAADVLVIDITADWPE